MSRPFHVAVILDEDYKLCGSRGFLKARILLLVALVV
jgi:hypothetical protein